MVDTPNPSTPEPPAAPVIPVVSRLSDTQRYALYGLVALTGVALILSAMARRARHQPGVEYFAPGDSGDWEASIRHLAAAIDHRFAGIQQQLNSLHAAVGTTGTADHVSPTVPNIPPVVAPNGTNAPAVPAATSGDPINDTPPGPAAVSL